MVFYSVSEGLVDIIVLYKFLLKAPSKAMLILLLTALYLGGQLAHGGHLHVDAHDFSVLECNFCSFSSAVITNTHLNYFLLMSLAIVYSVTRYLSPAHHFAVSAHGTRAPPLIVY